MSRRIVITGGGSGIGLAIAKRHLAEGARVAICDEDISLVKMASENHEIAIFWLKIAFFLKSSCRIIKPF